MANRSGRWQVGLGTLFLLMAAVAAWLAYFVNRGEIAELEARIAVLRPLARELVVGDPTRISVVRQEALHHDENTWEIHLPPGRFRLCLATRDVDAGIQTLAPIKRSVPIAAGRHRLSLEKRRRGETWRVAVLERGKAILSAEEPGSWDLAHGSFGGGQFDLLEEKPADRPLVLFRRQFMNQPDGNGWTTGPGPCDGLQLWIEPEPVPKSAP